MSRERRQFLGLSFDLLDRDEALAWITGRPPDADFAYVVTPNVDHIVQLERAGEGAVANAYANADLCLCDSRILARLARVSGITLPVVPGSDLTRELLESGTLRGTIAVVGGDNAVHRALAKRYPDTRWQYHQPPMGILRDPKARYAIARFVEAAKAGVTLLAIGAPQSELCCSEIAQRGRANGTALCIGASLEFLVGAKRRAPAWVQRAGQEWLFRLLSEPGRLWRRYLLEGPHVFAIWWRWRRTGQR